MGRSAKPHCKVCGVRKDREFGPFFIVSEPIVKCIFRDSYLMLKINLVNNLTLKKKKFHIPNCVCETLTAQKAYLKAIYNYLIRAMW